MNQFEKMIDTLNLYEEENKKLVALKTQNNVKEKQLREQFELWKNTHEQNFKKELDGILKEEAKLKIKNENLKKELKDAPAENISEEFLNYIKTSTKIIEKQLVKTDEELQELKNKSDIILKQYEKESNSKISELSKQVKQQEKSLIKAAKLVNENALHIAGYELEEFLIRYLKQTTGKNFIKMDDKTSYQYEYYEEYDTCYGNFHFIGLKCSDKIFKTFEELLKGISNQEVILLDIEEERHFTDEHKLFSLEEDYHFEKFKSETKITNVPYFTFLQDENLENSYFKIYPDLKEKLLSFIENKFIKEEKTKFNNTKNYIANLKNNIDTNEKQMNKEIENTIEKIKEKYAKNLKNNKIEYFEITSNYSKQKKEFEIFLNKNNKAEKVEEELSK